MSYAHKLTGATKIKLKDFNPADAGGLEREEGAARLAKLSNELTELQESLYAAAQHAVLIVLQGLDTSGKDGTIKAVMGPLNALGCTVSSFKAPTEKELAHDFLWRVHQHTPARGEIAIFNRSHYEDVLIVRVHDLLPPSVWRKRYEHINNFERLLADSHTIILKFYLHISKAEQEQRLLAREADQEKYWKLSVGDWKERAHWNKYIHAYEDALNQCSTPQAPWYVVPADKKWFRNLAVAEAIVNTLRPYQKHWLGSLAEVGRREKRLINEFRKEK